MKTPKTPKIFGFLLDWLTETLLLINCMIFSIVLYIQNESYETITGLWVISGFIYLLSLTTPGGNYHNSRDM